jgi:hypothetical protein
MWQGVLGILEFRRGLRVGLVERNLGVWHLGTLMIGIQDMDEVYII